MNRWLTQFIDRRVIQLACAAQSKAGTFESRSEKALELLGQPDFFNREVTRPQMVKWSSENNFQFRSAISTQWPECNVVHGKLIRARGNWRKKPAVILVHGWNEELGYRLRHPYLAKKFSESGINAVMIELPYHMQRRPRKRGAVNDFLSEDLFCSVQAIQQAYVDIRSLAAWVAEQGCPQIGLWGISLGAWLSGLTICHDDRINFAILTGPVARLDRVVADVDFCAPIRRSMAQVKFDFEKLNLHSYQPKIPPEKILFVEAIYDLFSARETVEELFETWKHPEIWRIPHAHITGLFSPPLLKRTVSWAREKAFSASESSRLPG